MDFTLKIFCLILPASMEAAISGISYMDPLHQRNLKASLPGEDPCNPLYWYPQKIPDYCYRATEVQPSPPLPPPPPPPAPIPAPPFPPLPMPMPIPMPYPMPLPAYPPLVYPALPQYAPPAAPVLPLTGQMPFGMSASFGIPPAQPYPYPPPPPERQAGLVPGVPGMVSSDGGINILPFSDVYSDMLEKHKQKLIRIRLEKVLDEYDNFPYKKYRKHKSEIGSY